MVKDAVDRRTSE